MEVIWRGRGLLKSFRQLTDRFRFAVLQVWTKQMGLLQVQEKVRRWKCQKTLRWNASSISCTFSVPTLERRFHKRLFDKPKSSEQWIWVMKLCKLTKLSQQDLVQTKAIRPIRSVNNFLSSPKTKPKNKSLLKAFLGPSDKKCPDDNGPKSLLTPPWLKMWEGRVASGGGGEAFVL